MSKFIEIKNAFVIVRTRSGMYREAGLFRYKNEIYAKSGSGYIKLYANNCTSSDSVKWNEIQGVEYTNSTKGGLTYARLKKQ